MRILYKTKTPRNNNDPLAKDYSAEQLGTSRVVPRGKRQRRARIAALSGNFLGGLLFLRFTIFPSPFVST